MTKFPPAESNDMRDVAIKVDIAAKRLNKSIDRYVEQRRRLERVKRRFFVIVFCCMFVMYATLVLFLSG